MWKRHIKNWGYKAKFQIKYMFFRRLNIIACSLSILGILLTIAELQRVFFESTKIYDCLHEYNSFILFVTFAISICKCRFKFIRKYSIKNTDIAITLSVTDMINSKTAIIIPTNSTFDTKMEGEFISAGSVQGQFQNRFFENNLGVLDKLIENGLLNKTYETLNRSSSKSKQYPIGTVSKITHNGLHYYFVAVAHINEYGKPVNSKFENIQSALESIWSELEKRGHVEDISIPLIGTGRAGIQDITREKIIKEIIFSFIASSKERKVTECLNICIYPSDLKADSLDLNELMTYLEYMCKYKYSESSTTNIGTPIS